MFFTKSLIPNNKIPKNFQQFNQVIIIIVAYIVNNKLLIKTEPKSIRIDLPIKIN